jgi:hypothetical protein
LGEAGGISHPELARTGGLNMPGMLQAVYWTNAHIIHIMTLVSSRQADPLSLIVEVTGEKEKDKTVKKPKQLFGGDWTEQKLESVRKYLVAYAKIIGYAGISGWFRSNRFADPATIHEVHIH